MHNARLDKSPRLQRTLKALRNAKGEISSFDLTLQVRTPSIGTAISELRANGAKINCRQEAKNGKRVYYYSLIKEPKGHK